MRTHDRTNGAGSVSMRVKGGKIAKRQVIVYLVCVQRCFRTYLTEHDKESRMYIEIKGDYSIIYKI